MQGFHRSHPLPERSYILLHQLRIQPFVVTAGGRYFLRTLRRLLQFSISGHDQHTGDKVKSDQSSASWPEVRWTDVVVKFKVCKNQLGQYHWLSIFKCSPHYSYWSFSCCSKGGRKRRAGTEALLLREGTAGKTPLSPSEPGLLLMLLAAFCGWMSPCVRRAGSKMTFSYVGCQKCTRKSCLWSGKFREWYHGPWIRNPSPEHFNSPKTSTQNGVLQIIFVLFYNFHSRFRLSASSRLLEWLLLLKLAF